MQMGTDEQSAQCDESWLGDGRCDKICASINNDNGDCSDNLNTCSPGCFRGMIGDEICNPECQTTECEFDQGDCETCAPGCPNYLLGNQWCDPLCFNVACQFDNGDCQMEPYNWSAATTDECAPHCHFSMLSDGHCDDACLSKECNYDGSDCGCSPECPLRFINDGFCDSKCRNEGCMWDGGDCGDDWSLATCNNGKCHSDSFWDGVCECDCDTIDCMWDMGECKPGDCMVCPVGYESHIGTHELVCLEICGDGLIMSDNYMACDSGATNDPGCYECITRQGYLCEGEPSVCTKCGLGEIAVYPSNGDRAYCTAECGDGWIHDKDDDKNCDDGNDRNDDGCNSYCRIEDDWSCKGEPSICGPYDDIDNFGNEEEENLGDIIGGWFD